ncbi:MAG: GNAT family N-acetyltransferase [Gammaproteobacteria bacterium]|nr:GNAT family N-acetyltransferase [Gammaproteobacteria bacterium]
MASARDNAGLKPMPVSKYMVRAADMASDRDVVLALWGQAFPAPAQHPIKYDWCYGHTPQGVGRLYLLVYGEDGSVIGVQGIVPRRWWLHGEIKNMGICADLVVDKQHRSIGPALAMVRQVIEIEHSSSHTELLYGFPNTKSEALYRRAGYHKAGELTRYVRPLRLHVWLSRKGLPAIVARVLAKPADLARQLRVRFASLSAARHWRMVTVNEFDARFDALWARVAATAFAPMVMRDSAFLRWRFGNHFAGQTRIMVLENRKNQIDGYVAYLVNPGNMVVVLDFLVADNTTMLSGLLNLFICEMYQRHYAGVTLEFSGTESISQTLLRCGFSPRETNPVYAVLNQTESGWLQGEPPYFTSCDRDQ